jgi:hypothetical protein
MSIRYFTPKQIHLTPRQIIGKRFALGSQSSRQKKLLNSSNNVLIPFQINKAQNISYHSSKQFQIERILENEEDKYGFLLSSRPMAWFEEIGYFPMINCYKMLSELCNKRCVLVDIGVYCNSNDYIY